MAKSNVGNVKQRITAATTAAATTICFGDERNDYKHIIYE